MNPTFRPRTFVTNISVLLLLPDRCPCCDLVNSTRMGPINWNIIDSRWRSGKRRGTTWSRCMTVERVYHGRAMNDQETVNLRYQHARRTNLCYHVLRLIIGSYRPEENINLACERCREFERKRPAIVQMLEIIRLRRNLLNLINYLC